MRIASFKTGRLPACHLHVSAACHHANLLEHCDRQHNCASTFAAQTDDFLGGARNKDAGWEKNKKTGPEERSDATRCYERGAPGLTTRNKKLWASLRTWPSGLQGSPPNQGAVPGLGRAALRSALCAISALRKAPAARKARDGDWKDVNSGCRPSQSHGTADDEKHPDPSGSWIQWIASGSISYNLYGLVIRFYGLEYVYNYGKP